MEETKIRWEIYIIVLDNPQTEGAVGVSVLPLN